MATDKQIAANKANAQLGGVKTVMGKSASKWNALKHGLLAKEVLIDTGDGREKRDGFEQVLSELHAHYGPVGMEEEILVEAAAINYWRYRRVIKHEVGLLRNQLDDFKDSYFNPKPKLADLSSFQKNQFHVQEELEGLATCVKLLESEQQTEANDVVGIYEENASMAFDSIFRGVVLSNKKIPWRPDFGNRYQEGETEPLAIYSYLIEEGWTPEEIRAELLKIAREKLESKNREHAELKAADDRNLSRIEKLGSLVSQQDMDRILRYEKTILGHFFKTLHELERKQRLRLGQAVPAPMALDVDVSHQPPE
ncbi:hypothetical protein BVX98_04575 [bacterium F11]|nr:hypothetical protein BVX98_04575 [bacterium F11]